MKSYPQLIQKYVKFTPFHYNLQAKVYRNSLHFFN